MDRISFLNNLAVTKANYNLGAGVPPLDLYPTFHAEEYLQLFKPNASDTILHYHQTEGILSDIAAETFWTNEHCKINSQQILITNGVQEAISIALLAFSGKTIACFDPAYPGLTDAAHIAKSKLVLLDVLSWKEQINSMDAGSLIYLSGDFANPTGISFSIEERKSLLAVAEKKDLFIFDDATYRAFNLDEKMPSFLHIHPDRVIHALSFSKILAPGLRTGFISVPPSLFPLFKKIKAGLSLNNSGITQAIVGGWLLHQQYQLSTHLQLIRDRLIAHKAILDSYSCFYEGGFFTQLTLPAGMVSFEWCNQLLKKESIAVCPMELFSANPRYHNSIRLAIANISSEKLKEFFEILVNIVK
jgi:DNA-binding transcriptional MocR family regulator